MDIGTVFLVFFLILLGFFILAGGIALAIFIRPGGVSFLEWLAFFPAQWLAERHRLFEKIPENEFAALGLGDAFDRILFQKKGFTLNSLGKIVREGTIDPQTGLSCHEPRHPFGGIRWLGPRRRIMPLRTRWQTVRQDLKVSPLHEQPLRTVFAGQHAFVIPVTDVETLGTVPVTFNLIVRTEVEDPYNFMYASRDINEMRAALIGPRFAGYAGDKDWRYITGHKQEAEDALWDSLQNAPGGNIITELREKFGLIVVGRITIKDVIPPADVQRQAIAETLAGYEAAAVRRSAQAQAERVTIFYSALQGIPQGALFYAFEQLAKSPAGMVTAHVIPGLTDLLSNLGRSQGPDIAALQRQIQEVAEAVRRLEARRP